MKRKTALFLIVVVVLVIGGGGAAVISHNNKQAMRDCEAARQQVEQENDKATKVLTKENKDVATTHWQRLDRLVKDDIPVCDATGGWFNATGGWFKHASELRHVTSELNQRASDVSSARDDLLTAVLENKVSSARNVLENKVKSAAGLLDGDGGDKEARRELKAAVDKGRDLLTSEDVSREFVERVGQVCERLDKAVSAFKKSCGSGDGATAGGQAGSGLHGLGQLFTQ